MFSTHIIIGEPGNLSVKYSNIYLINNVFYYFTNDSTLKLPYVNKFTNEYLWVPSIKYFSSELEITEYLKQFSFKEIKLAGLGDNLWYGNIGHALWDGLYPIYVALVKFGHQNSSFTYLTNDFSNKNTLAYDPTLKFCGGEILEYPKIKEHVYFNELVAGTGIVGNRVMTSDYTLYGEKEYNALTFFKNRLLSCYGISVDKPINEKLKVIIIKNKRYADNEIGIIKDIVNRFSNVLDIKYIDWYHDYRSFGEQLKELEDVDIHITGPGTGMMYMPLLKKGAVNINLGYIEHTQTNTSRPNIFVNGATVDDFLIPGYMEQAVCAGANYVSTIYYDRYAHNNLEFEPLVNLIKEAISIVNKHKTIESNHFIDAKIYIEYCKRCKNPKDVVAYLTGLAFFIELFINEHPAAMNDKIIDVQLLRNIKQEFMFNNKYQISI